MSEKEKSTNEGISVHSFEDGEEIRVNILDWNSSVLLTFGSEAEYRKFCEDVAKLQRMGEKKVLCDGEKHQ